jgi:hypothetical protein
VLRGIVSAVFGLLVRRRREPPVLSSLDGTHRHPERFSRRFAGQVAQARKALGEEQLLRLHDLRHTRVTLLFADGVPVKVVSERVGHANATITPTVYQHVHPAWAVRLPTGSRHSWRADRATKYHAGITSASGVPTVCHAGLLTCRNTGVGRVRGATRYIRTRQVE